MHRTPRTQLAKIWINKHFAHHYKCGPEKVIELGRCAIIRRLNELMHNTDPGPGLVGMGNECEGSVLAAEYTARPKTLSASEYMDSLR